MKNWVFFCFGLLLASTSWGQRISIQKVKGSQAVVQFSEGNLRPGQVYELSPLELNRKHLIGLSFNFTNRKSDLSNALTETIFNLSAKYGWNFESYEVGPLLDFKATTIDSSTSNTYSVGGFADFNALANSIGEDFIYGLGGKMGLGQYDDGIQSAQDIIDFYAGPFVKWFPTGGNTGLRFDLGYTMQKWTGGAVINNRTISGLAGSAELIVYF